MSAAPCAAAHPLENLFGTGKGPPLTHAGVATDTAALTHYPQNAAFPPGLAGFRGWPTDSILNVYWWSNWLTY